MPTATVQESKYLNHSHPDAFVDWEKREPAFGCTKECPRCKGYGGWNLALNQYGMPAGYANTPFNRNRYMHFRCMCSHCQGWGYVAPEETCAGHDWAFVQNLGRCYNRYECKHCGQMSDVDSSD